MDRQIAWYKVLWRWRPAPIVIPLILMVGLATATLVAASNWSSFFPNQIVKTQSTQLAVDVTGGHHATYSEVDEDGNYQAAVFYGYCSMNCEVEANWAFVAVPHGAGAPDEVSLALDGTKPRILVRGRKLVDPDSFLLDHPYHYLSCDGSCTTATNWADSGAVAISDFSDPFHDDHSQSYFALHEGKPRFLYRKEYTFRDPEPAPPVGLYLAYCDANCTSAGNWHSQFVTPLNALLAEYPSLAIDPSGRPHFALGQTGSDFYERLFYFACSDPTCSTPPVSRELDRLGSPSGWRLRLDSAGRPRLAFRQGEVEGGANRLLYSWCDVDCTGSGTWQSYAVPGIPQGSLDGLQPDLVMTTDARYISYHQDSPATDGSTTFVAFLSTCRANCESPTGSVWTHEQIDTTAAMEAEFPPPYPGCPYTFWYSGYRSSLTLGPDGVPRIGHDAVVLSGRSTSSGIEVCAETWRAARLSVPGGTDTAPATPTPTATHTPTATPTAEATPTATMPPGLIPRSYLPFVVQQAIPGW